MSDRSSKLLERNDIIRRINNLQEAKASIDNECADLNRRLQKLDLESPVTQKPEQTSTPVLVTDTTSTYSFARRAVLDRDSSFDRVSGKSAAALQHGIENFDSGIVLENEPQ